MTSPNAGNFLCLHTLVACASPASRKLPQVKAGLIRDKQSLVFTFEVTGSHALPAQPKSGKRCDLLWQKTCFEVFIAPQGDESYWEVNAAPSGDWNVYRFSSYRRGMSPELAISQLPMTITTCTATCWRAQWVVSLVASLQNESLVLGLSAVIEDATGDLLYFSLAHPGDKPDFHDRAGFHLSI